MLIDHEVLVKDESLKSSLAKFFSFFEIPLVSASKMCLKVQKVYYRTNFFIGLLNAFLRRIPKEYQKKKSTLLLYFFMLFLNLVSYMMISDFHFLPTPHDLSILDTKRANVWHIVACCTSQYCHSTTKGIL